MPIGKALFETYELLEKIILYLPSTDIHGKRGVAKFWDELIRDSKAICDAYCLNPIKQLSKLDAPDVKHKRLTPLYPDNVYLGPRSIRQWAGG